jgi:uncharacterized protein (DUF2141 family)
MKIQLLIIGAIAMGFAFLAPRVQAGELAVTISDIRADQGQLLVAVVNSDAGWDNQEKPVAVDKVAAVKADGEGRIVLRFNLPAGSYAVQVMHDENDNGKLDTNFMGLPVEGYGFSNNPQVMRRALFDEARFTITEAPAAIVVRLR